MAKRSHPALYEVIRSKGELSPARSAPRESAERPAWSPESMGAGQAVRIPVGYLWISVGAVVAACVLSYVIGHAAGRRGADLERGRELGDSLAAMERAIGPGVDDPLRIGRPETNGTRGTPGSAGSPTGRSRTDAAAPVAGDPRQPGWHYYVLAHGTEEGAPRMALFLTEQGVDARVVPDHNGRLRKVIALPGFAERAEQSSAAAEAQRKSIEDALRKWRQSTGDRSRRQPDYYLEHHRPAPRS